MLLLSHPVFPTPDIERTAQYYVSVLGFRRVDCLCATEPHICLYRDQVEIILTRAGCSVTPNRLLYGYGYDAYFITAEAETLQAEFLARGARIVRRLTVTDYQNREFVIEDIDGRWLGFGIKQRAPEQ